MEVVVTHNEANTKSKPKISPSVLSTLQPIMSIEKAFAMCRYKVIGEDIIKADVKAKVVGILVSSIFIVLLFQFSNSFTLSTEQGVVNIIDNIPSFLVIFEYLVVVNITSFKCSEVNASIVSILIVIDKYFHINMNESFYRTARSYSYLFLSVLFSCHIIFHFNECMMEWESVNRFITWPFYLFQDLEVVFLCRLLCIVKTRLDIVNNLLEKIYHKHDIRKCKLFTISKVSYISNPVINRKVEIKELAAMYNLIGETCSLMNKVFNFSMFMALVCAFSNVVVTVWTTLYYSRKLRESVTGSLVISATWTFSGICTISSMSIACEILRNTRKKTKILLNEIIMDYSLTREVRAQAKSFMELTDAWPLEFIVYDMVSVDVTLILKFISICTTYLVVSIQMMKHLF